MEPNWTEIVAAIGNFVIATISCVGFVYVVKQIRGHAIDHLYTRMHDIHKVFSQKPQLREYFYNSRVLLENDPNKAEVLIMAEILADFFQQVYLELDHIPKTATKGWKSYMRDILKESPVLREYVVSHADWYNKGFVQQLINTP